MSPGSDAPLGPLAAVARLWGPPPAPTRPARGTLTRDGIVRAAIELADADGLAAVSMSRVAGRLGSAAMSLYRHVADKDELLLLMHDAAWRPPEPPAVDADWRRGLRAWCLAQHEVLRAHPWLEQIRLAERAGTPSQLAWMEWGLRALEPTPLSERDRLQVLLLLSGYTLWQARLHAETAAAAQAEGSSMPEATREFGGLIRSVVDPYRFPALLRAVAAGAFDATGGPGYASFGFGLDRLLDGVEMLAAAAPDADRA